MSQRTTSRGSGGSPSEFSEVFTSFPTSGLKDHQTDPNIISNIFNKFKSVASNAVQQVLPSNSSDSTLSNNTLVVSLARPSRMSTRNYPPIRVKPASNGRAKSSNQRPLTFPGSATTSIASATLSSLNFSDSHQPINVSSTISSDQNDHSNRIIGHLIPTPTPSISVETEHAYPVLSNTLDSSYSGKDGDRDSDTESIISNARNYFISRVDRRPAPLKSGGLGKEFWMKDENATECFGCSTTFTSK